MQKFTSLSGKVSEILVCSCIISLIFSIFAGAYPHLQIFFYFLLFILNPVSEQL